ncbi:IS66 family insertion sequence element accessory protein TnpA, partial [Thiolapillus sp.]
MNKRRSRTEWQALIDEQIASGLTQKAFCGQQG